MAKIMSLTRAQEIDATKTYVDALDTGRSTKPINQPEVERIITALYARLGKPAPRFLRLSSPPMCLLAWMVLAKSPALRGQLRGQLGGQLWGQLWGQLGDQLRGQLRGQLGGQLGGQLWGQLRDQLWGQLGDQLRGQLGDQLWGQLGGQLWGQLGDQLRGQLRGQLGGQLGGQLWGQLRDQLWGQLGDQLRGQLGDQLWGQLGGQLWGQLWGQLRDQLWGQLGGQLWGQLSRAAFWGGHWPAIWVWSKFSQQIGVRFTQDQSDHLDLWYGQWREAHWWLAYEGVVLLSERPTACTTDLQGRLHNEAGPALGYGDGYGLWAIHGVRVSQRVIEQPETVTAEQIRNEPNAEVRRVMLARFGESRYLDEIGAELEHEDEFGQLYRARIPGDEDLVMVRVMNSTPEPDGSIKPYTLRVDPSCHTAQDAVASTWRYSDTGARVFPRAEDYQPAVET